MSNGLDPDLGRHSVDPDLGPNNFQRLSEDNRSQLAGKELEVYNPRKCTKYETCANLNRFHILYFSFNCES